MKKCLAVADFLSEDNKNRIRKEAEAAGYRVIFCDSPADLNGEEKDAEILYCSDAETVRNAVNLKWCHSPYAGAEALLATGVFDSGEVILTNSSGAYGRAISEYIIMASLMLLKQMPAYRKITDERGWVQDLPTRSVYGSRISIIGTGDIGRNAAGRFHALSASRVTGFNLSGRQAEGFDAVYKISEFEEHAGDTDILVMCVPGTPGTEGLLSAGRIRCLPETAYVINVGRGTTIDQDALIDALNEGRLAGAMLDVMMPEPLPADHPLWTARNCIVTPHVSGDMSLPYTVDVTVDFFCENLKRYVSGRELTHIVRPEAGY